MKVHLVPIQVDYGIMSNEGGIESRSLQLDEYVKWSKYHLAIANTFDQSMGASHLAASNAEKSLYP